MPNVYLRERNKCIATVACMIPICSSGALCPQDRSGTARYDSVCVGCPLWDDCQNCTMSEITSGPVCSRAPEHTTANEFGNTLETLSIQTGYWRATTSSDIILACYNPRACRGGQTGTETFCRDGYTGACKCVMPAYHVVPAYGTATPLHCAGT